MGNRRDDFIVGGLLFERGYEISLNVPVITKLTFVGCSELAASANKFTLSFNAAAIALSIAQVEHLHQLLILRLREIRQRLGFEALGLHLHDVTDIRSGPIKRRAFPTGAIDAAHAIDIGVGGAGHFDEGLGLAGFFKRRAFGLHLMMPESAAAPVAGEGGVVPGAEAGFVDVNRAAAAAAAVVGEGLDALVVEVFVEARVAVVVEAGEVMEAHVPAAAVVRVVTGEDVHQRADGDFEDVARARGVDFESGAIGPHADDAAAAMLERFAIGAGGLHEAEVAARDVKPAVDAEAESVRGVIGGAVLVTEGDILHEDILLLRDAVVIGINELAEVRRMHEVESVVIPHEPARRIDLAEHLRLIRSAIAIEIAQADDATALRIAAQRAVSVRGNVKRAIRLRGDEDRVVRRGAVREKRDLKALGDFHILQNGCFLLRRELHDLRRDVAAALVGIIRLDGGLFLLVAELWRDGFDAFARELHFANADPATLARSRAGDLHKAGVDGLGKAVLAGARRWLWGIDSAGPGFAIRGGFDEVGVGVVGALPVDADGVELGRLFELQLQPLRPAAIGCAPAGAQIAIDGTPVVVLFA